MINGQSKFYLSFNCFSTGIKDFPKYNLNHDQIFEKAIDWSQSDFQTGNTKSELRKWVVREIVMKKLA